MSRTVVSIPFPARMALRGIAQAIALVGLVASCSMPVESGESSESQEAESVDELTAAVTLRSGCDGHYAFNVYKKNGQPWALPTDFEYLPISENARWRPFASFDISKSGSSVLDWLARERARRVAKDAIIECGEAHWRNRWSPGLPAACSGTDVHNYPFENIKEALERATQSYACPYANYGDELTVKLLVYATGTGDCKQDPGNSASYGTYYFEGTRHRTVYEPYKNSYLTETYVYRCLTPPMRN